MVIKKEIKKVVVKKTPVKKTAVNSSLTMNVYGVSGDVKKTIDLPKEIFGVEVNPSLLSQYVRVYLINQRQGTVSTKTRSEVIGSTRKIYKQKGTGKARHGDIKAPIFVGGGVVGGPKPKKYEANISKKQKMLAMVSALTLSVQNKAIIGMADEFLKEKLKTKNIVQFIKKVGITEKKVLLVLNKVEKNNLVLASRNIAKLKIIDAQSLNPYTILNGGKLIFIEEGFNSLIKRLNANK